MSEPLLRLGLYQENVPQKVNYKVITLLSMPQILFIKHELVLKVGFDDNSPIRLND